MSLLLKKVDRPRELKWYQASAMLYGDWGTSKAYVLGLAFAIAGHASLFFLLAMNALVILVGACYIVICKAFPDGGGVYSSVRHRSRTIAFIGALLLFADYVVTASLSSLDAFHYLGLQNPQYWAIGSLFLIGLLNYMGPGKSGNVAALIGFVTIALLAVLCAVALPALRFTQITPPQGTFFSNWGKFVGIVLALSGVEAVANLTGIMVEPVKRTAKHAILPVLFEVTIVSMILGAAMNAIPGLTGHTEDMIKVIGEHYIGAWFGNAIALALGFLLISACNTAIVDMVNILFLMSKDKELPGVFSRLNRYGMPYIGLMLAVSVPVVVLLLEHDITRLAALYAIGVVGAITINLIATSTNFTVHVKKHERILLMAAGAVMLVIEATIIYEKHNAVIFASSVLVVGLAARFAAKTVEKRRVVVVPEVLGVNVLTSEEAKDLMPLYRGTTLVAVKTFNPSLIEECSLHVKGKDESVVYALYVDEKPPGWAYPTEAEPSKEAVKILNQTAEEFNKKGITTVPLWHLSENAGSSIVKTCKELDLQTVIIGTTKRGTLERLVRGEVLKTISNELPQDKHLVICN